MTTLVDTNILIKVLDEGAEHHGWAVEELEKCKADGPAIITDIVYCEFSVGMKTLEEVDAAVSKLSLERVGCSDAALFRAGTAFKTYRDQNKGPKPGVLPDFIIGAVAEVEGLPLLTTNAQDFAGYFPKLKIISP